MNQPYSDSDVTPDKWPALYASVRKIALPQPVPARLYTWRHPAWLAALERVLAAFSPGERLLLYILSAIAGLSCLILVGGVNALASITIPAKGGTLIEGEIGPARFLNPLLTISDADEDLSALVYSGLMRALPDGSLVPDLAESYTISADGRTYTFKLRPTATFQNGTRVTSADVVFTVKAAQDPVINSSHRADWTGVTVTAPDEGTVVFTLPNAYAPFLQNTTLGILPKSLWENIPAEEFRFAPINQHPVGSGPFQVANLATDSTGAATRYDLVPFARYALGAPYLSQISFLFYQSTDALVKALNAGTVDAAGGLSPEDLSGVTRNDIAIAEEPLPRIFGVFFNQSHNPVLADLAVRQALDAAVDKSKLVKTALVGRGVPLASPIPPGFLDNRNPATPKPPSDIVSSASIADDTRIENARAILQKGGWTLDASSTQSGAWTKAGKTLSFTLVTADQPELLATAKAIIADWQSLGVLVNLQTYSLADLNATVIRPRTYDSLLFGEVVGPELDAYAFLAFEPAKRPRTQSCALCESKSRFAPLTSARDDQ